MKRISLLIAFVFALEHDLLCKIECLGFLINHLFHLSAILCIQACKSYDFFFDESIYRAIYRVCGLFEKIDIITLNLHSIEGLAGLTRRALDDLVTIGANCWL